MFTFPFSSVSVSLFLASFFVRSFLHFINIFLFQGLQFIFFLSAFKDILSVLTLHYLCVAFPPLWVSFLSFPPRHCSSSLFVCFFQFTHFLTWLLLVLSMLTIFYPTISRIHSSFLLDERYIFFPTHTIWNILALSHHFFTCSNQRQGGGWKPPFLLH